MLQWRCTHVLCMHDVPCRHSFVSAYDFGPWPLLEGVTELHPAVTQVRHLKGSAAAPSAWAAVHASDVHSCDAMGVHVAGCSHPLYSAIYLAPISCATDCHILCGRGVRYVTCRRCNQLQQCSPTGLCLMSCRWTLSSQPCKQPVKQGQPYALTQVGSGSHQAGATAHRQHTPTTCVL